MRTDYSVKNSITSVISNITTLILSFVSRSIFIHVLNTEFLGLNGLFSNILSILSLFELGIGNAMIYKLYKPVAENNIEEVKTYIKFYKKAYNIITIIISILGILIIPFIGTLVGEISADVNIYLAYILFLLSSISSYLVVYKMSLIYANQLNYIINIIHIIYLILLNTIQIIILLLTKNYYLYLVIKICCQLAENFVITIYANKKFPFLLDKNTKKISNKEEKEIFNKIKALIFHKIGSVVVNGTDNIIISYFFGVIKVGLYSNYYLIINSIAVLFNQVIVSTSSSVGNLIAIEGKEKKFEIFSKLRFLNFWICCFSGISIFVIVQPFITIWLGKDFLLSIYVLITLILNYYFTITKTTYTTFKDSAGIWEEDKFVPIIEATLNIVLSVIFLKIFGLSGVFIGTILSGLVLWCYSYPKFVYKKLFDRAYKNYTKETLGYILLFIITAIITYSISLLLVVSNQFLQIIINIIICLIVPNLILFIIFRKTDNFKYFKELVFKILSKVIKRKIK